jgi:hypothetical protein
MNIKTKTVIAVIGLGLIDILIPIPILALTILYIIFQRPPWFVDVVREIYEQ